MANRVKFIQVTDPHLAPRGTLLHGLDPVERLEACVADINQNHSDAELCVVSGDIAHGGELETYRDFHECISKLELPVYLMVGNHDRRATLLEVFSDTPVDQNGFIQSTIDTSAGLFVLLDTVEEGKAWGRFCDRRLAWLSKVLDAASDRAVFLFMHHPPFDVGLYCVDRIGLGGDGDRISAIVKAHKNIRHLFFGHVHRPISGSWHGIPFSTLRGLNHQVPFEFAPVDVVPKSHEPPAYAVVFVEPHQVTVHAHDYLDTYRVPYGKVTEGRPDWN